MRHDIAKDIDKNKFKDPQNEHRLTEVTPLNNLLEPRQDAATFPILPFPISIPIKLLQ